MAGEAVFTGKTDYEEFTGVLRETAELRNIRIAAYSLMPNHYHLLAQTPEAILSRCMRHINGVYTQRFNRLHHGDGQLFRGRYKSILVDADSYPLQLVRYIHRNPLRAGLADTLKEYAWGSHRGYLTRAKEWDWLRKEYVLSMLSRQTLGRLKAYRAFMALEDEEIILGVLEKKKRPSILGSENFVNRIKDEFFAGKAHDEIPQSRELAPGPGRIKQVACAFYGVDEGSLMASRRGVFNEPRNVAIYLTRRLRGDGLREVGGQFGMRKCSSTGSVIERMQAELARDPDIRKRVNEIRLLLTKSQEQT